LAAFWAKKASDESNFMCTFTKNTRKFDELSVYYDSAIVEFSDFGGMDSTSPQTESLSFTNHKSNAIHFDVPQKQEEAIASSCIILATPVSVARAAQQARTLGVKRTRF